MNNKPKILYVDDEELNIKVFQLTFSECFEVLTADSAMKGMEIFCNDPNINFVISDMRMPVMNGLEFIRKIKSVCKHTPCSILSAYQQNPEIMNALNNGEIVDYLMKPFDKGAIERLINRHINDTTGN
ncbi:response regulator [Draconibacterium halophilum]|uniref:Response regulator n=1 Tax=Draconibacterium halophilum TaxID=2706887 RepID=A0A6C0RI36_9BACT|nr:response regulator [Draconibacterium halophilum]QIA09799.1 response regulator [Draconibacterium halophilum]